MSAIDSRLDLFRDLHSNNWFHVMNWVLDELRVPKEERRRHFLFAQSFYFNKKDIPQKHWRYNYNNFW